MRIAAFVLIAALAAAGCRSVPEASRADAAFASYLQAVRAGAPLASGAAAVADAELADVAPAERCGPASSAAQAQRALALALAASDADESLAREEVALALLDRGCPGYSKAKIPVLLHQAQLHSQRGDATALAACARRAQALEPTGLTANRLQDWPLLRQQGELLELIGDFAGAARIERGLLDAKLQILAADHPQVAASRARIATLEARERQLPPVGAAPPDPAR